MIFAENTIITFLYHLAWGYKKISRGNSWESFAYNYSRASAASCNIENTKWREYKRKYAYTIYYTERERERERERV